MNEITDQLRDLIDQQDSITHLNDSNVPHKQLRPYMVKRDKIRKDIIQATLDQSAKIVDLILALNREKKAHRETQAQLDGALNRMDEVDAKLDQILTALQEQQWIA